MSPYRVPQCGQGSGYDDSDIEAVTRLLRSDAHLSSGQEVAAFEREFAQRTGTQHAVAVTSCTMALQLVTRVLDLEPGDEVIATPLTFQATVAPLLDRPVTVRFADISPETLCLDADSVRRLITPRTRAVYTTHYGGLCADLEQLSDLTRQHGIALVEDCAHALGASYLGRSAGAWGDMACWSFHSLKNISTLGQGGMVTLNDDDRAERIRQLRGINPDAVFRRRPDRAAFGRYGTASLPRPDNHEKNAYTHDCMRIRSSGLNATMSEPAAAVGRSQLRRLDQFGDRRRHLAALLDEGLSQLPGVTVIGTPPGSVHARHLYTFLLNDANIDRDELARSLGRRGIEIVLRYFPLHLLPEWRARGGRFGDVPVAERIWFTELVNLPLSPQLSDDQARFMVETVGHALAAVRRQADPRPTTGAGRLAGTGRESRYA